MLVVPGCAHAQVRGVMDEKYTKAHITVVGQGFVGSAAEVLVLAAGGFGIALGCFAASPGPFALLEAWGEEEEDCP